MRWIHLETRCSKKLGVVRLLTQKAEKLMRKVIFLMMKEIS